MMFEPFINWENPYKIERGGGGQAILYGYKIGNFPETLDHIPNITQSNNDHTKFQKWTLSHNHLHAQTLQKTSTPKLCLKLCMSGHDCLSGYQNTIASP